MTCASAPSVFRLLDAYVGWDAESAEGLTGLDDPTGVRLADLRADPNSIDDTSLSERIPPLWLSRGCDRCDWYLLTRSPPRSRLIELGPCDNNWRPVRPGDCPPNDLENGLALSTGRYRIVIADAGAGLLRIWDSGGQRDAAVIAMDALGPVAVSPWGHIVVATPGAERLQRFDFAGLPQGSMGPRLPGGTVDRLSFDERCRLWIAVAMPDGSFRLRLAGPEDDVFTPATLHDLRVAFPPTGITAVSEIGFCIQRVAPDGVPRNFCYSWHGRPVAEECVRAELRGHFAQKGQLLTKAIDSGTPRCRWHRVRIDADLPSGSGLSLAVATSEEPSPLAQGVIERNWTDFQVGIPHPEDWQTGPPSTLDFLINQPAGRYLFVRLRLTGDGAVTPVVRRVRIDFPRLTSLEHLPAVYREDEAAGDFAERFLNLFDSVIEDVDAGIERFPALLDGEGVPAEVLPWIATFLGIVFDTAWDEDRRRRILRAAPELYRKRGTIEGLAMAVRTIFDIDPVIQELGIRRAWGAVAKRDASRPRDTDARLGFVHLFGRGRARFRLGQSELGRAAVRSFGNPDTDPHNAGAHRFRVLVAPGKTVDPNRLSRLVESQKPAHTLAEVHLGGRGFVIGPSPAVGIDTAFVSPPAPVLGTQSARLNRVAILRGSQRLGGPTLRTDLASAVGIHTVME